MTSAHRQKLKLKSLKQTQHSEGRLYVMEDYIPTSVTLSALLPRKSNVLLRHASCIRFALCPSTLAKYQAETVIQNGTDAAPVADPSPWGSVGTVRYF